MEWLDDMDILIKQESGREIHVNTNMILRMRLGLKPKNTEEVTK